MLSLGQQRCWPRNMPHLVNSGSAYSTRPNAISASLNTVNKNKHPPHRCVISRCWLDSMIIAQVCLRLNTIKGHSNTCSFITQHNATDVASFQGACNWHTELELSLFQNLHLSLYLSLLPLLACTYLNNAWDLVLLALPLYVCLFKINRFMYSPIVSRFG